MKKMEKNLKKYKSVTNGYYNDIDYKKKYIRIIVKIIDKC